MVNRGRFFVAVATVVFSIIFSAPRAQAVTITVAPGGSIQAAINQAVAGDVIMVSPGTYREFLVIDNKNGRTDAPIRIVGTATDPAAYPVLDGGNVNYASNADKPVLKITNSSHIAIERLSFQNSGLATIAVEKSHFITVRRTKMNYLKYGVLLRDKSSHLLMERNDFFQAYPAGSTWDKLKDSKWEGGALTSFGGAGMHVVRYNYFHDSFNGIYFGNDGRTGDYYDANVFIYRNRFEKIVDDPYEPESYAFNNHFFQNTVINSHRIISLAPQNKGTGPIYVYNNQMSLFSDPTLQAAKGTINAPFKLELSPNNYPRGVYLFNNSIDADYPGTNSVGNDMLSSTVNYLTQKNNVFKTLKNVFTSNSLTLKNSVISGDLSHKSFGYAEPNAIANADPKYLNPTGEDVRLAAGSPAIGRAQELANLVGFSASPVVRAGADLGAFPYGGSDFVSAPEPQYVVPPGGEDASFPANAAWPADAFGGYNPPHGPSWHASGKVSYTAGGSVTVAPTVPNTVTVTKQPTSTLAPSQIPLRKVGDANADRQVNDADLQIWKQSFMVKRSSGGPNIGDFNSNGVVDGVDYLLWLTNYGS